ncbi:MAG: single-stranded-DNA-specific exonuclease RecJ [Caldilineales bacterium]
MQPSKRWIVHPTAPNSQFVQLSHLHRVLVQLLWNRGISDPADAEAFLYGDTRPDDPFRIKGMNEAVARIRRALAAQQLIAVYGDFDADGVTATALLEQTLTALGGKVTSYIPHRVDEGYGLNNNALADLAQRGVKLVITVDCGIRSLAEVAYANRLGLDVIITDHHSVGSELPAALAVINPKRADCPYPFKGLAGVGLAFKLAQALLRVERQAPQGMAPVDLQEQDLLDLVALGTVADLAPLLSENRALVRRGLMQLNRTQRPGLLALLHTGAVAQGQATASSIGFILGPRLNAAGRLESARLSYELLLTGDSVRAAELSRQLSELNTRRQQLTAEAYSLAVAQITSEPDASWLHVARSEHFLSGIVGLVAGRLVESYYRPALVLEMGETQSRGSARSIAEFDITAALDRCAAEGLLVRHGGHAAAAGLTVENARLERLLARLRELAAEALSDKDLRAPLLIDQEIRLDSIDFSLVELLAGMEPTGYANPQPRFLTRNLKVHEKRCVGTDNAHLKLRVSDPAAGGRQGQQVWDAIAFRQGHWFPHNLQAIDAVYAVEKNIWNGQTRLQLVIEDLRPAQS